MSDDIPKTLQNDQTVTNLQLNQNFANRTQAGHGDLIERPVLTKPSSAHPSRRRPMYPPGQAASQPNYRGMQKNKTTVSKVGILNNEAPDAYNEVRQSHPKFNVSASASNMSEYKARLKKHAINSIVGHCEGKILNLIDSASPEDLKELVKNEIRNQASSLE